MILPTEEGCKIRFLEQLQSLHSGNLEAPRNQKNNLNYIFCARNVCETVSTNIVVSSCTRLHLYVFGPFELKTPPHNGSVISRKDREKSPKSQPRPILGPRRRSYTQAHS